MTVASLGVLAPRPRAQQVVVGPSCSVDAQLAARAEVMTRAAFAHLRAARRTTEKPSIAVLRREIAQALPCASAVCTRDAGMVP